MGVVLQIEDLRVIGAPSVVRELVCRVDHTHLHAQVGMQTQFVAMLSLDRGVVLALTLFSKSRLVSASEDAG